MTRTPDLLITNQLLYQLSYASVGAIHSANHFSISTWVSSRAEEKLSVKICYNAEAGKGKIGKYVDCIFYVSVLNYCIIKML